MKKLDKAQWDLAIKELSKKDPVMRHLVKTYRGESLKSRGNAYETLVRSIVGQQISVKAADSVWNKVKVTCEHLSPENIQNLEDLTLRNCGLSERKVQYIRDLSLHFLNGKLAPHTWATKTDNEVKAELIAVKGIGPWTAEMFLLFHLLRPDVFPRADLGLQKAISLHYKVKYPMSERTLNKFNKLYSPWCSVATWYLWRSLDPIPVEY
jgi:DNA-3-methyladenine glycosylase II